MHSRSSSLKHAFAVVIPRSAAAATAALVFCLRACPVAAAAHSNTPTNLWYEISLDKTPIGGDRETDSLARRDGVLCTLTVSVSRVAVTELGTSVVQETSSSDWTGKASGLPIFESTKITSDGRAMIVTARFAGRTVTATMTSGGDVETRVLTVPRGAVLMAGDPTTAPPTSRAKHYVYFDAATLALEPVVVAPAPGQPRVKPRILTVTTPTMGTVTVEQDASGEPIRISMPGGISMVRSSESTVAPFLAGGDSAAVASGTGSAPDFAVVTSVVPTGAPLLPNPDRLIARVKESSGPWTTYDIREAPLLAPGEARATVASVAGQADLAADLSNTPYLGLNDTILKDRAGQIVGDRTNLYDIAVQIQKWVSRNMTPSASIGVPRSAVEILGDRQGVCRDYALLYTALARAAGVPTKLCAGLVGYRGRFYYHAWAESYIGGKIGWMPFDPTLDELPVDASHIPLVMGDPASLYDLVGNIGAIKVQIVRCSA